MPTKKPEAAYHRVNIAKALRAVREQQGMTQGELATKAGLQQQLVSRYESDLGGIEPSASTIYALETAMGVFHGSVLREADMVQLPGNTIEGLLEADPLISPEMRETVLNVYLIARRYASARTETTGRGPARGRKASAQ